VIVAEVSVGLTSGLGALKLKGDDPLLLVGCVGAEPKSGLLSVVPNRGAGGTTGGSARSDGAFPNRESWVDGLDREKKGFCCLSSEEPAGARFRVGIDGGLLSSFLSGTPKRFVAEGVDGADIG